MKHPYLQTGKIVSTHGVHGEVKLLPWADGPEFLLQFHTLYLDGKAYQVEQSRVQKTCVLLKLEGVDTVEAASALRDKVVSIARADAKLPEGSLFIADLLGLPVYDGETMLGTLAEVMPTPANDVYVVKSEDGQELLLAVRNLAARVRGRAGGAEQAAWRLDVAGMRLVAPTGGAVVLSPREVLLLEQFVPAAGQPVSRRSLDADQHG